MRSQNVAAIVRLPLEVLEVIINFSLLETRLAISRISKLFHSLTLRTLYREISLRSPRMVINCCRTLASNTGAAATVRSLSITYTCVFPFLKLVPFIYLIQNRYYSSATNSLLASYYTLIRKALSSIPDIHTLRLLVHDPYFVSLLNPSSFRSLRHFECLLTPSTPLIDFLNRHPKLEYLQISPHEDTSETAEAATVILPPLNLPLLQYFSGNAQHASSLCCSTRLRAAFLSWNAIDTDPELIFTSLGRSSRDNLCLLSCRRRGWNLDLLEAASIHLPDLTSLHISNVLLVDSSPTEVCLGSNVIILI